ncbi:unnamed protein product, partial [marine sediment metagenome]
MSTEWKPIDHEGHVDPDSVTHIVFLGDHSMPKVSSKDSKDFAVIYQQLNPEMWKAIHLRRPQGVPLYWAYVKRTDSSGTVDPGHMIGPHLEKLGIPDSSSVFVQFIGVKIEGVEYPVTLETIVKTREPICVVAAKSPIPCSKPRGRGKETIVKTREPICNVAAKSPD